MPSIFHTSLDAIYKSQIGTDATFAALPGMVLRVVDKTSGIVAKPLGRGVSMPTAEPAATVRRYELADKGLDAVASLAKTLVTFNGVTWLIYNTEPLPQPGGEAEGEVRLLLRKP